MIDDFTSIDKNSNYIAKSFSDIFDDKEVVFLIIIQMAKLSEFLINT